MITLRLKCLLAGLALGTTPALLAQNDATPVVGMYQEPFKVPQWQFSLSPTAALANTFKLEVVGRINTTQMLGLQAGWLSGQVQVEDLDGNSMRERINGVSLKPIHKIYLLDGSSTGFFVEHGPIFISASIPYREMGWVNFIEDGVEFLRWGEIERSYQSQRLGYEAGLGMEIHQSFFYMQLSLHMGFLQKISTEDPPEHYDLNGIVNGIDYTGPRFIPALRIGMALD